MPKFLQNSLRQFYKNIKGQVISTEIVKQSNESLKPNYLTCLVIYSNLEQYRFKQKSGLNHSNLNNVKNLISFTMAISTIKKEVLLNT